MATPMTIGHARALGWAISDAGMDEELPVTGLAWPEAVQLATAAGGRLPTSAEWQWMASAGARRYPWGEADPEPGHANLRALGPGAITPVGAYPVGATPDGLLDVAGNVWEWTSTCVPGGGAVVRGGSYQSIRLYAQSGFANEIPTATTSPGIGLRVVIDT
ncbi:formylglycine-generating enzyme family protein [Microtetraspora malaysiensis]|uniref:Formylglycine-generating enzyme family protein n=1 Tax=Microtetraspora malaysiensis TaxID=161358 RepID=A0ABW6SNT0_9ACTN